MWELFIKEIFSFSYFFHASFFYVNRQNTPSPITRIPANNKIVDQSEWNFVWCNVLDWSFIPQNFKSLGQLHLGESHYFWNNLICCSSTHGFVWDCNPAFSVHIFYPKWRLEKQLKIFKKSKWRKITNKICNLIDFDPLNTNMCMVCWFNRYLRC